MTVIGCRRDRSSVKTLLLHILAIVAAACVQACSSPSVSTPATERAINCGTASATNEGHSEIRISIQVLGTKRDMRDGIPIAIDMDPIQFTDLNGAVLHDNDLAEAIENPDNWDSGVSRVYLIPFEGLPVRAVVQDLNALKNIVRELKHPPPRGVVFAILLPGLDE